MGATEAIIKMAKENNGTVTTAMVVAAGFSRGNIKYLVDKGMIEKSTRGVYILPEVWDDEIFNLQNRFKRGIYSYETALFFQHLITEEVQTNLSITVPQGFNITRLKNICPNLTAHYVQPERLELGLSYGTSPEGNPIRLYNRERCICDIIKHREQIASDIYVQAVQNYFQPKKNTFPKDLRLLQSYAHTYGIENQVYHYMEFLM